MDSREIVKACLRMLRHYREEAYPLNPAREGESVPAGRSRRDLDALSGMAAMQMDREGRRTFVNDHAVKLFGRSRDELLQGRFGDTLLPEDKDEMERAFKAVMTVKRGVPLLGLVSRHIVKGRIRHIYSNWLPIENDHGNVTGLQTTSIDISEWVQREEWLRQQEQFFRRIVESGEVGIVRLDRDGRWLYGNDCARRLWGKGLEEVLHGLFTDVVVPEDRAKAHQALHEVVETGSVCTNLLLRYDTPTSPMWYVNTLSPIKNALGMTESVQLTSIDVTPVIEGKQPVSALDDLYRSLVEATGSAVIRVDREGNRTFMNDYASSLMDGTTEGIVTGVFGDTMLPADRTKAWALLRETFQTGKPVRGFVTKHLIKGEQRFISANWEPIADASGDVTEVQITATDITERVRADEQRIKSERLKALANMAGGFAHDVNNILAAIMLWTDIAQSRADSSEVREALANALEALDRGAETMRRLQRFAEPGKPGRRETLDLKEMASDSILFTRPMWKDQAEAKDIYIKVEENLDDVPSVMGNSAELREVIVNLITNAIEAMPEGGTLTVRTCRKDDTVSLVISDTGEGIGQDEIAHIFDPFTTTKGGGGRGLGLSVVQSVIALHEGNVEVESQKGEGSTFIVSLPILIEDVAAEGSKASPRRRKR